MLQVLFLLLNSALTQPSIRAPNKCLLAQSFPPLVFLPFTLYRSLFLFTTSTNFSKTILSHQSSFSVLPHLFFFRFNFCSSFDTSSTGLDQHRRHQQQLLQHFARLQPNRSQPRAPQQNLNHSFDRFLLVSLHFISAVVATLSSIPSSSIHQLTNKELNFFNIRLRLGWHRQKQRRLQ